MKLFNLIMKVFALICLGLAVLEGNITSMICAAILLVDIELEKICDAIREKGLKNECNSDLQEH